MTGISMVTKGFISSNITSNVGGGSPPVYRNENISKPDIKVIGFKIKDSMQESLTDENFTIKTVKIVEKDY